MPHTAIGLPEKALCKRRPESEYGPDLSLQGLLGTVRRRLTARRHLSARVFFCIQSPRFGDFFILPKKGGISVKKDAFSQLHPAVEFLFFLLAIGFGVAIRHPLYILAGCVCGGG